MREAPDRGLLTCCTCTPWPQVTVEPPAWDPLLTSELGSQHPAAHARLRAFLWDEQEADFFYSHMLPSAPARCIEQRTARRPRLPVPRMQQSSPS